MSLKIICAVFLSFSFLVNAKSDKFSFTLAIDNTASMQGEIDGVKLAATRIFDAVLKSGSALIENYVLVTINDPYVKLITVTDDPDELKRHLNSIKLDSSRNPDCPELALLGVEMAIENSLPRSLVYVFTDADAKDAHLLEKVRNLAYRKQIQLVFVLTEYCYSDFDPTYATLATATNGIVFKGDKSTKVDKILNYAVESVTKRRILISKSTFPPGAHNMNVTVDPTMSDVIGMGLGKNVVLGKVYNPDGTLAHTESVIDTPDAKAVKVNCTQPGKYDFHFESKSNTTVIFQASTSLDFYHGFSSKKPLSIPGTSMLPLPDVKSHLAIDVKSDEEVLIAKVELHDVSEKLILEMPLEKLGKNFYVTEPFTPPSGLFYITIKGVLLKSKTPIKRKSATPVETQNRKFVKTKDKSPTITMEKAIIDAEYDQPLSITCDVQAYPTPTIAWYDNVDNEVSNNVENYEIPYGYKNTLEISNVDKNTTYTCKAKNFLGEVTSIVTINTKRKHYFDVLSRPSDITIKYKKSGNVSCSIDSDPPSTISWERDSTELVSDSKMEISSDKTQLNIKEMTPDLVGNYNCIADNGVNSEDFNFKILIDGVAPTVTIDVAKLELEYDEPVHVDCKITGYPKPKVAWKDLDTGAIILSITKKSDDVKYDYMNTLEIVQSKKNATYQCFASNDKGDDSKNVEIETGLRFNILEEPKDINIEFKRSGTIKCKVDANPMAKLTWIKNRVELLSNDSFDIIGNKDGSSILTIKDMRPFLEGNYVCRAANDFQTEEMNFHIVLTGTAPKTAIDWSPKINAEYDAPLEILCKVSGYPEPDISWHDKGTGEVIVSNPTTVDEPYDYGKTLLISAVNKNATYTCRAKNLLGEHSTEIQVETKRKFYFNIQVPPKDTKIEYRKSAKINCVVDSYPPSTITWNKEDKEITVDSNIEIMDNGTTLHIKRATEIISGTYTCKAQNGHNSTAVFFNIDILGVAPVVSIEGGAQQIVEYDATVNLECKVTGFPAPKIIWEEVDSGNIIPSTTVSSVDKEYDFVSILQIDDAEKNATYQCSAANAKGADNASVEVVIEVYINVLKAPKDLNVQFRKNANTKCKVKASPPTIITWHKDGIKIRSDGNLDVVYGSDGSSTLLIDNMRPHMAGEYSCRAANAFMTEDIKFQIMVTGTAAKTSIDDAPKINAEYDQPLSLLCKVSGYPEPQIIWQNKDTGKEIPSSPSTVDEPYDYGKTLSISAVNKNATYTCRAKNPLGEHSTEIQVETKMKTYFNIQVPPKDTKIEYRKSAKINCVVDSYPPSTITWNKGDKEIPVDSNIEIMDNGNTLHIKRATEKISGTYSCKAQNGHNSTAVFFNIDILGVAPVVSIEGGAQQIVEYDATVNLECKVTGFPAPKIIWEEVDSGNIIPSTTVPSVDKEYDFVSILHIDNAKKNATYQCSTANAKGADNENVEVVIQVYINILKAPKDLNVQFRKNARTKCKVDASPPAIITWHKDGIKIRSDGNFDVVYGSDGSSTLLIDNMRPHIAGQYSCRAANDFMVEDIKFQITVTGIAAKTSISEAPVINAEYDQPLSLLCEVSGYPEPQIIWLNKDTGKEVHSSLAPVDPAYDHGKILQIDKVNKNETYTCKAKNSLGEHSTEVQIVTVRITYFDVLVEPKNTTIKYKENGQVICDVKANPPADIIWYKDSMELKNETHISISQNRTVLSITDMQPILGGSYTCRPNNKDNDMLFHFKVDIIGILKPEIDKSIDQVKVVEGSMAVIPCRIIRGDPVPTISWRFRAKTDTRYKDMKERGNEIEITNVRRNHAGAYRCSAINAGGPDRLTIDLVVEYPPTIKIRNKKSVSLMQGQTKILYCDASGDPQPTVTWLLNDAPVYGSEYEIYSDESIKIEASVHNVGRFTCLAKNEHGEATTTTTVDYIAPVQIDIPKDTKIEVLEGAEIKMPCVADGYPQPKIQWKFFASNATTPKLLKDAVSPDTLVIPARLERAGFYICTAHNGESDAKNLAYEVIVNAPPRIVEKDTSKTYRAVKGDFCLKLPCAVTGWPEPDISWTKNGFYIPSGTEWYDIADDGTLLIKNIDEGGSYFCSANNKHGSDSKSFEVQLDEFPSPSPPSETIRVYIGDTAHIKCDLPHQLVDQLRWYKDGKLLAEGELTLNNVDAKDAGLYTCRVSTLSGSDSSTVRVEVLRP